MPQVGHSREFSHSKRPLDLAGSSRTWSVCGGHLVAVVQRLILNRVAVYVQVGVLASALADRDDPPGPEGRGSVTPAGDPGERPSHPGSSPNGLHAPFGSLSSRKTSNLHRLRALERELRQSMSVPAGGQAPPPTQNYF
ncbi:Hypothetical predicted protein [Pelobates cultripes]|uniref:Uncharacterized protein n=1 Tax=Pelobates cultripes TaxID=61616 RepID=A0AAD1SQP8_PELCU|nr:Hypothetical predicted protein [Pelobates cultripes]